MTGLLATKVRGTARMYVAATSPHVLSTDRALWAHFVTWSEMGDNMCWTISSVAVVEFCTLKAFLSCMSMCDVVSMQCGDISLCLLANLR